MQRTGKLQNRRTASVGYPVIIAKRVIVLFVLSLTLSLLAGSASASTYAVVHTHTGFGKLNGLASDARGNVYVGDQVHNQILELSPAGKPVARFPTGSGGIMSVAVSPAGDVYALTATPQLRHFSPAGRLLQRYVPPSAVTAVALDPAGHVFLAYGYNGSPSGYVELTAGCTLIRKVALAQRLPGSFAFAVDAHDNLYLPISTNKYLPPPATNALMEVSPTGRVIRRWHQQAEQLAWGPGGTLYAADAIGEIVKQTAPGGKFGAAVRPGKDAYISTVAGLAVVGDRIIIDEQGPSFGPPNDIKTFSAAGKLIAVWKP